MAASIEIKAVVNNLIEHNRIVKQGDYMYMNSKRYYQLVFSNHAVPFDDRVDHCFKIAKSLI